MKILKKIDKEKKVSNKAKNELKGETCGEKKLDWHIVRWSKKKRMTYSTLYICSYHMLAAIYALNR